jgi:hypothetical protein
MPKSRRSRLAAVTSGAVDRVRDEPVLASNLTAAALSVAVGLGAPLTVDVKTGIIGLVIGVAALFARAKVIPVDKLVASAVTQSAPGEAVTVTPPDGAPIILGPQEEALP